MAQLAHGSEQFVYISVILSFSHSIRFSQLNPYYNYDKT